MPKAELPNGTALHYEQVGTGPDIVMAHGMGGNLAIWHLKIAPMLWDRYRILTYDLRGHGYSDLTPDGYTCTNLAADLRLLMDHLGVARADIVGHSFGADVALYFAYLYPERVKHVVLIEPMVPALVPTITRAQFERADWAATVLDKMGIPIPDDRRYDTEYMLREAMKHPIKWGPLKDIPARWTTDRIIALYSNTTILRDALDIGALTIDQIETIRVPVHLVYDRGSTLWRQAYRHLSRSLPNVTSTLLPTGSKEIAHFSPLEKPEVITEQILLAITRDGKARQRSSPAGKRSRTRPRFA